MPLSTRGGDSSSAAVSSPLFSPKRALLSEPFLTGLIPLCLLVGSDPARARTLHFLNQILSDRLHISATSFLSSLKVLVAVGVLARLNWFLSELALNYGHLRKQGVPWDFGPDGSEIVLITGGCSGFGLHMVKGFAEKVKKIIVVDIQDLPQELRTISNVHYYKCDLTVNDDIYKTASAIRIEHGSPSVLINNAGIAQAHTILDTKPAYLEKLFRINVLCHFTLVQEFLPDMLKAQKGHIVTLASMAGHYTVANLVDYCSTKAAVIAFHEGLMQELAHRYENGHCIQTTCVYPFWARTPLVQSWEKTLDAKKENVMPPTEVSNAIVDQILSGRSGQIFLPRRLAWSAWGRGAPTWLQELVRGANSTKTTIPAVAAGAGR